MSDYFQKILVTLAQDLTNLGPTALTPASSAVLTAQTLSCEQAANLLQVWYKSAATYNFQFDSFPHFRVLSSHLSEQHGCQRCRQIYTDLSKAAAQRSYAQLQELTTTARLILDHSLTATTDRAVWTFLLDHPQEHPSYSLPSVTFAAHLTLKSRLILPNPDIEPDEQPPAGLATLSLSLVAGSGASWPTLENSRLTLILRDVVGNDLWSGQSNFFSRDGRSRLAQVPLTALYQTVTLVWALHLPAVLPTVQPRPAQFAQIGFNSQHLVTPLQKWRELYQQNTDSTSALEAALAGTRQFNENISFEGAEGGLHNEWAVQIARQNWYEQGVTIHLWANPHPTKVDYYDLQVRILDMAKTPPVPDQRRWVVQIEPDLLEKETKTGQVTFENLKLPPLLLSGNEDTNWELFLWIHD